MIETTWLDITLTIINLIILISCIIGLIIFIKKVIKKIINNCK